MNKRLFMKNASAKEGLLQSRYRKETANIIRESDNYKTENEEIAILRKELKNALDMLSTYLGYNISSQEFRDWYDTCEKAKEEAKKNIGIY